MATPMRSHARLGRPKCQSLHSLISTILASSCQLLWGEISNDVNLLFPFVFSAPEIQHKSQCSASSDIFSLGMLMVSVFNLGQSLIQANYSTSAYFKQAGVVSISTRHPDTLVRRTNMSCRMWFHCNYLHNLRQCIKCLLFNLCCMS